MLGRALDKNTRGTLLFDEMEKAHPLVLDLFLQILDAGRITLANGETRNLNNYYIVFTSNIGAGEAMRMESSAFATIERTVLRRVDQVLRPELVARINEKLVFNRLPYAIQREICELMIGREVQRLNGLGHNLGCQTRRSRNSRAGGISSNSGCKADAKYSRSVFARNSTPKVIGK